MGSCCRKQRTRKNQRQETTSASYLPSRYQGITDCPNPIHFQNPSCKGFGEIQFFIFQPLQPKRWSHGRLKEPFLSVHHTTWGKLSQVEEMVKDWGTPYMLGTPIGTAVLRGAAHPLASQGGKLTCTGLAPCTSSFRLPMHLRGQG